MSRNNLYLVLLLFQETFYNFFQCVFNLFFICFAWNLLTALGQKAGHTCFLDKREQNVFHVSRCHENNIRTINKVQTHSISVHFAETRGCVQKKKVRQKLLVSWGMYTRGGTWVYLWITLMLKTVTTLRGFWKGSPLLWSKWFKPVLLFVRFQCWGSRVKVRVKKGSYQKCKLKVVLLLLVRMLLYIIIIR